ncbi:lysophospholipid acyltransferase family protein [Geomonas anaerohicana]|uniref:1-acyl-sn-glycerol-3-phosphate acyltransferase n=1 Tax=Geomonas anaerohicana TaxID=2798583 RepID=A0ABS0Y8W2_9BACT|nr:lysophospholipid acyltransferase family protein [Geomonas anaerohicana]MBJ6748735.1 1-acyl-sn-glycerol-3-phosphate acyltransferase [Geomonas anaerohicana]
MTPQKTARHREKSGRFWLLRTLLLNLTFYPLMVLWTAAGIVASPLCLILWKLVTGWDLGRITRHLISIHGYGMVVITAPFVRFSSTGTESIRRPCILVINHLSFFDSYYMSTLPFHDIVFAVGAWPFKMYWYTLFMRLAQYLDVESAPWEDVVATCSATFAKKGVVIFYPEGHRSRTGRLQPFYSGAFRLAKETGVPIVPLVITGTDNLLPPGRFALYPSRVRLKVLPPMDPASFPGHNGHLGLRREVRERMTRALAEMQGETGDMRKSQ